MGLDCSASLAVGISMAKLFTEFKESSNTFDEHDKFGQKTGKQFQEKRLIGVLPNGNEHVISEKKGQFGWDYNFYDSLGFDGGDYIGDHITVELQILRGSYDTNDLSQMIMGIEVADTENMNGGSQFITKVEEDITNAAIDRARKQLAELFGYTGELNLYLIQNLSY